MSQPGLYFLLTAKQEDNWKSNFCRHLMSTPQDPYPTCSHLTPGDPRSAFFAIGTPLQPLNPSSSDLQEESDPMGLAVQSRTLLPPQSESGGPLEARETVQTQMLFVLGHSTTCWRLGYMTPRVPDMYSRLRRLSLVTQYRQEGHQGDPDKRFSPLHSPPCYVSTSY